MSDALISKKDLLQSTKISYGQLYRWKRENLIPESWFIKQSVFTGQETYFPRNKILKRIALILDLKDKYSLEEIETMIHPNPNRKMFKASELVKVSGIKPNVVELFEETKGIDFFTFSEVQFILVVSSIGNELVKKGVDIRNMIKNMLDWAQIVTSASNRIVVLEKKHIHIFILHAIDAMVSFDTEIRQVASFNMEEILEGFERRLYETMEDE